MWGVPAKDPLSCLHQQVLYRTLHLPPALKSRPTVLRWLAFCGQPLIQENNEQEWWASAVVTLLSCSVSSQGSIWPTVTSDEKTQSSGEPCLFPRGYKIVPRQGRLSCATLFQSQNKTRQVSCPNPKVKPLDKCLSSLWEKHRPAQSWRDPQANVHGKHLLCCASVRRSVCIQETVEEDTDPFQRHVTSEKIHLQSQTCGIKLVRAYHMRSKPASPLDHQTLTKGRTVPFLLGLKRKSS